MDPSSLLFSLLGVVVQAAFKTVGNVGDMHVRVVSSCVMNDLLLPGISRIIYCLSGSALREWLYVCCH